MAGPRRAEELRRERGKTSREDDVETTIESRHSPARPGTVETGRPSRDDLGAMERRDLRHGASGNAQPPASQAPTRGGPAAEERGRMDRDELTGDRAQSEERTDGDEVDTQGSQKKERPDTPTR